MIKVHKQKNLKVFLVSQLKHGEILFNYLNQNIPSDKMAGLRWHSDNDHTPEKTDAKKREVCKAGSYFQPVGEMGLESILLTLVPVLNHESEIT